jgi:hypothetical protein
MNVFLHQPDPRGFDPMPQGIGIAQLLSSGDTRAPVNENEAASRWNLHAGTSL